MSNVLFLSAPAHGNVNPTLGLVSELVKRGEEVHYFSSPLFKEQVEAAGAHFHAYSADLDIYKAQGRQGGNHPLNEVLNTATTSIDEILEVAHAIKADYLIHSAGFPFAGIIKQILRIPSIASFAVFAGLRQFEERMKMATPETAPHLKPMFDTYALKASQLEATYDITLPTNPLMLIFNKGDVNLVYTSKLFATDSDYFDDTYKFVGPPIYQRKEEEDFPVAQLEGKKVIYISLGTVFSTFNEKLYPVFFEAFGNTDAVVVMAAYSVDLSQYQIPSNFIVRHFIPQATVLKHTTVAVTHAGMNSISDLVHNAVPFVALPLGADQPLLAKQASELNAAISLDAATVDAATLKAAVEQVITDPRYLENIRKIKTSFDEAGGYSKAADEIFELKKARGIVN